MKRWNAWRPMGRAGQVQYTDAAIQTSLMMGTAFNPALRQAKGLMISVLTLMGLTISAPDHTTVSTFYPCTTLGCVGAVF